MKTIYICIFLVLATTFSLQAQFLSDETFLLYSDSFASSSQDFSSAGDLNFEMDLNHSPFSTFNFQLPTYSSLSPSDDWLTNRFGATYAGGSSDGWLMLPQSNPGATGLKIPVGNGTMTLMLIIGLYTIIISIRKKLRIEGFAL